MAELTQMQRAAGGSSCEGWGALAALCTRLCQCL